MVPLYRWCESVMMNKRFHEIIQIPMIDIHQKFKVPSFMIDFVRSQGNIARNILDHHQTGGAHDGSHD